MFVQIIRAKAADPGGIRKEMDRWRDELAPGADGWLGVTAGVSTNGEYWSVVRFESEEAARRNSDRPEQGTWWNDMSRHFDGDATFYECTDPQVWAGGGSDEAGFVQIMSGVARDRAKLEEMMQGGEDEMRDTRPDVMGGTYCPIGDKEFVTTVYFSSEAEARKGEQAGSGGPDEEQWNQLVEKIEYADLTEPYLVSK
jgi:hypothetical protein